MEYEYAVSPKSTYWLLFPAPILSTLSAYLISLAFGAIYVGVLYLSQRARVTFETINEHEGRGNGVKGTRDDPQIIKARLVAVSIATLACCAGIFCIVFTRMGADTHFLDIALDATLMRLGLPAALPAAALPSAAALRPHLVVPALFLGPLFAAALARELPLQRRWRWRSHVVERFGSIQGLRNYAVAPLTEELVFRACVLAVWHMAGIGRARMVFVAPLTFGLAHIHHGLETFYRYGGTRRAARQAVVGALFQFAYTTVFGFLTSYLFLRTGSVFPPLTAHIFCNVMGFPNLNGEVERHPRWRLAIYAAYVAGIAAFIWTLPRWTETRDNMYWPDETVYRKLKY